MHNFALLKTHVMSLNSIFQYFVPKDKKFFPLFEQAGSNLIEMAKLLKESVHTTDLQLRTDNSKLLEDLEHKGDNLTHQIHLELGKNFITPFDREDIHALASSLDDVADFIHGASNRMELYKVTETSDAMKEISSLILEATEHVAKALFELKDLKNIRNITDSCVRINSVENKADYIFDKAVAELFEYEKDAINLIKNKEVLSAMEDATDKCEDVANVLESILVKNA
ncbi:Phosphate transport regulator (distant homolog of PhoU) [Sphingobacterium daejeonense]|nr:Phosphate transport regulator (distant homolog of PhoU) [Sphingobacterium daejeonense]